MLLSTEKEARKITAFFAAGVQGGWGDNAYQKGDRLVYLNMHMNPGGCYSNTTGEYICEKSGVYYFTFSVYGYQIKDTQSHSKATGSLMKDGVKQSQVYFRNDNTEEIFITLSQSIVLECNAGEKVWVESPYDNNYIYGSSYRNVFAGFLLFMN